MYRQIIIKKAIPFTISTTQMSDEDLIEYEYAKIIEKRIANNNKNNDSVSFEQVYEELQKRINEDEKQLQDRILQGSKR